MNTPHELPIRFPHVGQRVLHWQSLDSTNSYLLELADDPSHDGTVAVAEQQTAGRGQYGRTWWSRPGSSLLMSLLVFPPYNSHPSALWIAWAAVAIANAIESCTGLSPTMKWPNDLLLSNRKVCGILLERRRGIVVGVGLNLSQTRDELDRAELPQATSLTLESHQTHQMLSVLTVILEKLNCSYQEILSGQLQCIEDSWIKLVGLLGHRVIIEWLDGTRTEDTLECLNLYEVFLRTKTAPTELVRHIRKA